MRLHGIAAALVGTSALATVTSCGDTLPPAEPSSDGGLIVADAESEPSIDAAPADADGNVDGGCTAPCNATEVATAQPVAMAASSTALSWLESNTVFALAPGTQPKVVMTPLNDGNATGFLALDAKTALMTQGSGVSRCNTDAPCGSNPSAPIYMMSTAGPVGAADDEMYSAEQAGARRLVTCGLLGNCNNAPPVLAYLPSVATRMAVTSSFVVLAFEDQTLRAYQRSERLEAGVPAPAPLATVADIRGLAGDGPDVYWTEGANGRIRRCRVDTCVPADVVTMRAFPRAIAIRSGRAYWVETDDHAVVRCTLPGCADAEVIARVNRPTDLVSGDRIYVASDSAQRIYAIDP